MRDQTGRLHPGQIRSTIPAMTKKRAAYGAGSMRERRPGVWQLRVSAGTDQVGKPIVINETFRTDPKSGKKAAAQRLAALVAEHTGRTRPGRHTLADLLDAWLDTGHHAAGTIANYRRAIKKIPDRLAELPADQVNGADLARLYRRLVDTGTSPHRVRYLHAALGAAYTAGVGWGWVGINPARTVRAPAAKKHAASAPGEEQVAAMLAAARKRGTREWVWLRLAIETGARRGEVLGLQWADVDVDAGVMLIRRSIESVTVAPKSTKTGYERSLDLSPELAAELKAWRLACKEDALAYGQRLTNQAYVISHEPDGSAPWRPDHASRLFAKVRRAAGVPDGVRLHDLRHANATALIGAGIDVRVVSDRLGHRQTSTTTNMYAHPLRARAQAAAALMGQFAQQSSLG